MNDGGIFVSRSEALESLNENRCSSEKNNALERALAVGYREMSRINLSLAEEAVPSDNEAAELCGQYLRSVNDCDS